MATHGLESVPVVLWFMWIFTSCLCILCLYASKWLRRVLSPGSVAKDSRAELGAWGLDLCWLRVASCRVNFRENVRVDCRVKCREISVPMWKVANGVLLWSLWLSSGVAMSMGEAAKRVGFEAVKVSKLMEASYEMLGLTVPHVSSCVCGAVLWRRRVYGGSCKARRCWSCQSAKIGGSLVRNTCFKAPTCLLLCLWGCPLASPCLWGKLQNA